MYTSLCPVLPVYTLVEHKLKTNGETRVVPILHLYPSDTGLAVLYYIQDVSGKLLRKKTLKVIIVILS